MGKRANSEGSVYFEKDRGKSCAVIPLPDDKVNQHRFDRQADANNALRQGTVRARRGTAC
jgi:hypothetical protein